MPAWPAMTPGRPHGAFLVLPEAFEPIRSQRRVAHRRGDGAVAQIMLDQPLLAAGKTLVIPPKANRKVQRTFDKEMYRRAISSRISFWFGCKKPHPPPKARLGCKHREERDCPERRDGTGRHGAQRTGEGALTFGKSLLHGLGNHLTDALAQDRIIVHWIEFIRRERLLRLQDRITGRTITVRVHG
jgi:hypothetical protein